MQSLIFSLRNDFSQSLPEKTGHKRNYYTDNYHGRDGDVYFQVGPVNYDIPGQAADGKLAQPWP